MGYKVISAYATLRVPNDLGQEVLVGFYEGAVLPEGVNRDDLDRHLRKGMVAEEGTPAAEAATPVGKAVEFDELGMPKTTDQQASGQSRPDEQRNGRPAGNASREAWAAHAAAAGAPEEETRPVEEGGLSRDDLRAKYGG